MTISRVALSNIQRQTTATRDAAKQSNISMGKENFPMEIKFKDLSCSRKELNMWLIDNKYRSWKQKGINGHFFESGTSYFFKDEIGVIVKLRFGK